MILSEYSNEEQKAQVVYEKNSGYGVKYFRNNDTPLTEWYVGKSEAYAESAAENYVLGIKTIPTQDLSKALVE
jgi:hypothetical protein